MLRKIPCQLGRKPKNIEESKREEEIPLTESNVELLISELKTHSPIDFLLDAEQRALSSRGEERGHAGQDLSLIHI